MPDAHLLVDRRDGIMTLTMNRPEVGNALSPQMLILLARAWYEFRDSADLRVAIFTGAGDTAFCVGGDLKLTMPLFTGARQPEDDWDRELVGSPKLFADAILRGLEIYKPIISAINGSALGGGTEMIQATDIRIAAENAVFGTPEARVGLLPGGGSLTRLARQIPYAHAMEILLTGRPFPAKKALEYGLINYVVAREDLIDKAHEIAEALAKNGPLALRKIKEGVIRTSGLPIDAALKIENEVSAAVMMSNDAREGPLAFAEKREPKFTGT